MSAPDYDEDFAADDEEDSDLDLNYDRILDDCFQGDHLDRDDEDDDRDDERLYEPSDKDND